MRHMYEYHCHPDARNDTTVPFFGHRCWRGLAIDQEHERKKLARSRIEKILELLNPNKDIEHLHTTSQFRRR